MTLGRVAAMMVFAAVLLAALPHTAFAWTPGTHVFLGDAVLRSYQLLPSAIADLLRAFPYDFLYGSIAADTSIAKKYAPVGRHCHSWDVGFDIYDAAIDEPLRAFSLGYLAHLAADAVAHNYFVPMQLTVTSSTTSIGHSYWESRFEMHLGERYSRRARDLILLDHSTSDSLLDAILSPTLFSIPTNRRLFRGMVRVADSESWQRIFHLMDENSRWDLPDDEVGAHMERSFDFIIDLMQRLDRSEPYRHDPSGDEPLHRAKRVRRQWLRAGDEATVREHAIENFGLPAPTLPFARSLPTPVYDPSRSANS